MTSTPAQPAFSDPVGSDPTTSRSEPKPVAPGGPAPGPDRFAPAELEAVLKRYDLGRIDSIREFIRGSPHAPKAVVGGPYGKFLVKRRAPGEDHPYQAAFCHALQLHLADRGFPAPALVGTRDDNNSMLQLDGRVYEVSEFIEGDPFDRTPDAARAAGTMLSRFHAGSRGFHSTFHTPADYTHADERAEILLDRCLDQLSSSAAKGLDPAALTDALRALWRRCVKDLDHAGITAWPRTLLHADWHPGNLVFSGRSVRAVLDYDSCRRGPRLIDLAGGTLHFSILSAPGGSSNSPGGSGGESASGQSPVATTTPSQPDPSTWPASPDVPRARAFLAGYQADQDPLSTAERGALAPAMAAAMILESLPPVATTGGFAGLPGDAFLEMVRRKSAWLMEHADDVAGFASA